MMEAAPGLVVGRYAIFEEIASGGMASVHLGRLLGAAGFSRTVAIKRLHPQFSKDAEFAGMFMDEARLAARIHHPNVVQTLDVVFSGPELLLVMEYVHGASLASLLGTSRRGGIRVDPRIIAAIVVNVLEGLHAAHEAKSETGAPLGVVHRDVSPQNVLVSAEGVAKLLDFGVAKAIGKMTATREGQLKGKLAYMSPEQVRGVDVTRQSDIFATAIVLWEALANARLFDGANPAELVMQVLTQPIEPPRQRFPDLPEALEAVVMKGLERDATKRYATAREMALALEEAIPLAAPREIARWVQGLANELLTARADLVSRIERRAVSEAPAPEPTSGVNAKPSLPSQAPVPISAPPPVSAPPPNSAPPPVSAMRPISAPPPRATPPSPPLPDALAPPVVPVRAMPVRPSRAVEAPTESLGARLAAPLKVIAVGVVLTLADIATRSLTASLPFRPAWIANVLVVVGVVWALVRLVMPPRT
jgi:serine/threonine-protein kinase